MPAYIVRLGGHLLCWSTVVDAPITFGMTLEEFIAWYKKEHGTTGMRDLQERLARVEATGCSARDENETATSVVQNNRAGSHETELSTEQIIYWYCVRKMNPACPANCIRCAKRRRRDEERNGRTP